MSRYSGLALGFACALVMVGGSAAASSGVHRAHSSVSSRGQRPIVRSPRDSASAGPRSPLPVSAAVNPVFRPILPRLKGVTIPVLLPTYIPRQDPKGPRLYATVDDHGLYSYLIDIGFTPDCHGGGACRFGEVTGGPEIDTPTIFDYPRGRHVRLRGGALALYYPYTCGASCGDSVLVFQREGVVYTVSLKAAALGDVLSMANSVAPVAVP